MITGMEATGELLNQPGGPVISGMMTAINKDSLLRARLAIKNKFKDPVDLEDLSIYAAQIKKQLALAESQLNGAVQSKLDSLKRAVDLMDESEVKLAEFTESIEKTEKRIAEANTEIAKMPYLRRIHYVRENLRKVTSQVEFFARVPETVKELRVLMETEPSRLKEVFLETIRLESLRLALINEIEGGGFRDREPQEDRRYHNQQRGGEEYLVSQRLDIVPDLLNDLIQHLMSNIDRFFELAMTSPADLVMTFEIIEMYQEYLDRRKDQNEMAKSRGNHFIVQIDHIDISGEAKDGIQRSLVQRVQSSFKAAHENAKKMRSRPAGKRKDGEGASEEQSEVALTLQAATQLMGLMSQFLVDVAPCIPPSYEAMSIFVDTFEAHIVPEIEQLSDPDHIAEMEVGEILQIVDWLEFFEVQMEQFGFHERKSCEIFKSIAEGLLGCYLERIKGQIGKWFKNIESQPLDVLTAPDGKLMTSHPEDMFTVLHAQVDVAIEKLPIDRLHIVVGACLSELQSAQRQSMNTLTETWTSLDPEKFCAVVNDLARIQEKCEEFAKKAIDPIPDGKVQDDLMGMVDEVIRTCGELGKQTVSLLARAILGDLDEPVFLQLFTYEWESSSFGKSLCSVLAHTLEDYLKDLERWLQDYFYGKLVCALLDMTMMKYVMSLRRMKAPANFHFNSEIMAAQKIILDMEELREFFEGHKDTIRRGGLTISVAEALQPIECFARTVSMTHITAVEKDVRLLFAKYGRDGLTVVQSAINCNPSLTKAERTDCLEKSQKIFDHSLKSEVHKKGEPKEMFPSLGVGTLPPNDMSPAPKAQEKRSVFGFFRRKN